MGDGHKTMESSNIKYSSVVSRGSFWLDFTITALNDIDMCACDIGNSYLNANFQEKLWTMVGVKFGRAKGSIMIIVKVLYGFKLSVTVWNGKLAETLKAMGYKYTEAHPDVWLKCSMK